MEILRDNKTFGTPLLKKLSHLTITALLCLQNLLESLDVPEVQDGISIKEVWDASERILQETGTYYIATSQYAGLHDNIFYLFLY